MFIKVYGWTWNSSKHFPELSKAFSSSSSSRSGGQWGWLLITFSHCSLIKILENVKLKSSFHTLMVPWSYAVILIRSSLIWIVLDIFIWFWFKHYLFASNTSSGYVVRPLGPSCIRKLSGAFGVHGSTIKWVAITKLWNRHMISFLFKTCVRILHDPRIPVRHKSRWIILNFFSRRFVSPDENSSGSKFYFMITDDQRLIW